MALVTWELGAGGARRETGNQGIFWLWGEGRMDREKVEPEGSKRRPRRHGRVSGESFSFGVLFSALAVSTTRLGAALALVRALLCARPSRLHAAVPPCWRLPMATGEQKRLQGAGPGVTAPDGAKRTRAEVFPLSEAFSHSPLAVPVTALAAEGAGSEV